MFGTVKDDYEAIYERGQRFEKVSHALLIAGGAAAVISTVLLAVHAGREKKRASRLSMTASGMELSF